MIDTEIIKKKMKRLGITQAKMAEHCGCSYQAINMLLNNKTLNKDLLESVCGFLDLEIRLVDLSPIEEKEQPKKTNNRVQLID